MPSVSVIAKFTAKAVAAAAGRIAAAIPLTSTVYSGLCTSKTIYLGRAAGPRAGEG